MSDLILTTNQPLPPKSITLHTANYLNIGISNASGQYQARHHKFGHILIATLSNDTTPAEIFSLLKIHRSKFLSHINVASGIICNTKSNEFCIFRDPFGFMPWLLSFSNLSRTGLPLTATTDPLIHQQIANKQVINRLWLAKFLLNHDSDSNDDVFEGSGRILPGEYFCAVKSSFDQFIDDLFDDNSTLSERFLIQRDCLWNHKNYQTFRESRRDLAGELRENIIRAVQRIPDDNPCFTLSGGLDSTAILSSWCHTHHNQYDAISLISSNYANCDESSELDILENAFPIRLKRVDMDEAWPLSIPSYYHKFRAYGPLVAPGIESVLAGYYAVEQLSGPRTIITGYGGNFIVKVRPDALLRHLISKCDFRQLAREIAHCDRHDIRYLMLRFLANYADGNIRRFIRRFRNNRTKIIRPDHLETWANALFCSQFSTIFADPFYAMSHTKERAEIPKYWSWECRTRCMDMIARLCPHRFYDPLFDMQVYDFCAQIPPQYFLDCGEYRPIYKDALTPLLPDAIIHHPKCQSFDCLMNAGITQFARPMLEQLIAQNSMPDFFDAQKLTEAYHLYCRDAENGEPEYSPDAIWQTLSTLLWFQGDAPLVT